MLELANTGRCASKNQVARLEGHDRRDISDQGANIEDHIARRCHLPHLPVDATGDDRISRVELGIDPGTKRTKRIEAFGARPLAIDLLQVTGGDIIADGVAKYMFLGILSG